MEQECVGLVLRHPIRCFHLMTSTSLFALVFRKVFCRIVSSYKLWMCPSLLRSAPLSLLSGIVKVLTALLIALLKGLLLDRKPHLITFIKREFFCDCHCFCTTDLNKI